MKRLSFWDKKYKTGFSQLYPWDSVVSFVYNQRPVNKCSKDIAILEIGCGTGSNLWFAAREGHSVSGTDCSKLAIEKAVCRFQSESLTGTFHVCDFPELPFNDASFDLVIDRAAITHVGISTANQTIQQVRRVMKNHAKFFCNTYSDYSSSFKGTVDIGDGLVGSITQGSLKNVGPICFYSREMMFELLHPFKIKSLNHLAKEELLVDRKQIHAEWQAIVEKSD